MNENGANAMESPRQLAQRVAMALTARLAATNGPTPTPSAPSPSVAPVSRPEEPSPSPSQAPFAGDSISPPVHGTAYVSMLPYAYTNSDVAQLFSQFGKIARVTILRDKQTRKSRGVAFIQFAHAEDCARAVEEMHDTELEGLRLACSVSRDNGRSQEFTRKRKYAPTVPGGVDRCFECGEYGHFSYNCPKNVLGARERPVHKKNLKKNKKKGYDASERGHYFNDEGVVNLLAPPKDGEDDLSLSLLAYPSTGSSFEPTEPGVAPARRKQRLTGRYFSDESGSDDDE